MGVFDGPFPWEHTLGFYLAGMESVKFRGQTGVACSDERSDTMFYLPAPGGTNGVSPLVWRRLLVSSKTNLTDLHEILQLAFGWSGFYLYEFRIHGRTFGDARSVCLADFQLHPGERFRYRYNFFVFWECDLRLEAILPHQGELAHPRCLGGRHLAPMKTTVVHGATSSYRTIISLRR